MNRNLSVILFLCTTNLLVNKVVCGKLDFPHGFKFGAATSAYQIEGAWNISGKGKSIWDTVTHNYPHLIGDRSSGDIATDSYHLWKRDVEVAEELGLHTYRFSISWPRLLPTGFPNKVNEDAVRDYSDLIDALLAKGIEPIVTIHHFDLPQALQDFGGWTNPLISDWFADYASIVYSLFADRVKIWLTINEPFFPCDFMYNAGILDPVVPKNQKFAPYLCNKHMLLAHAKAWRIYDQKYKLKYKGRVSLIIHGVWFEGNKTQDEESAELMRQNFVGRYAHPIYSKEGGWPSSIEKRFAENSKAEGYNTSRLPSFTAEEKELIKGTYDFFALNYYTSKLVRKAQQDEEVGFWPLFGAPEFGTVLEPRQDWKKSTLFWFKVYPEGLRYMLSWIKKQYGEISVMITENGFPTSGYSLKDDDRMQYYKDHLKQVLLAIKEDGVNVTGYTVWSLIDNFEWIDGYQIKFGLYEVDYSSPKRTRTPRASAEFYKQVIKKHSLNVTKRTPASVVVNHHDIHTLNGQKNSVNQNNSTEAYMRQIILNLCLIILLIVAVLIFITIYANRNKKINRRSQAESSRLRESKIQSESELS